ncbi:MAG: DUF3667 domain-containing protein [Pseudomonadota bacterium]|nr:DUF3667 domain-containing protein [Pseudomonadota bacterium]
MASTVIYEVECQLDPDIVPEYDDWLPGHVRDVLACAGFLGATIEAIQTAAGERPRRRVRYRVESAAALDLYLENDATRLRTMATERFGSALQCERRVLTRHSEVVPAALEPAHCLNCGTAIEGSHCAACGQAGDVHVLSMREVAGDVTHSLLHLDSRVWRTLRLLMLKPGELTREFIAGRHQRYLPPFRLYLAISILFFALSALLPGSSIFSTDGEGNTGAAPVKVLMPDSADELPADLRQELEAEGLDLDTIGKAAADGKRCNMEVPVILGLDLEQPLQRACERIRADGGAGLAARFAATAPKLMFLFLPLMAAVALLFYWRPRRLYTEHLVLFLHNHAFTFLLLGVMEIVSTIAAIPMPFLGVVGFLNFLLFLYLPWYVFRSMRVVYGEGRLKTSLKFLVLTIIYFMLLGITMMAGLVYSMLSL